MKENLINNFTLKKKLYPIHTHTIIFVPRGYGTNSRDIIMKSLSVHNNHQYEFNGGFIRALWGFLVYCMGILVGLVCVGVGGISLPEF